MIFNKSSRLKVFYNMMIMVSLWVSGLLIYLYIFVNVVKVRIVIS